VRSPIPAYRAAVLETLSKSGSQQSSGSQPSSGSPQSGPVSLARILDSVPRIRMSGSQEVAPKGVLKDISEVTLEDVTERWPRWKQFGNETG